MKPPPNCTIHEFDATAEMQDGSQVPFWLRVSEPELDEGHGYFCVVECPFLRDEPFKIFGVDEEQACELSISFINQNPKCPVSRIIFIPSYR